MAIEAETHKHAYYRMTLSSGVAEFYLPEEMDREEIGYVEELFELLMRRFYKNAAKQNQENKPEVPRND